METFEKFMDWLVLENKNKTMINSFHNRRKLQPAPALVSACLERLFRQFEMDQIEKSKSKNTSSKSNS